MIFSLFKKPKKKEEPLPYVDKIISLSHADITVRFNKVTGVTTIVKFDTPLTGKNIYPRCWVCKEGRIDLEFESIIRERTPYSSTEDRKEFVSGMNKLLNLFNKCYSAWDVDNTHIQKGLYEYLSSFEDWNSGIKIFNIFMESTVEWLRLQQNKFDLLYNREPELRLTEEEYEAILASMQRFNNSKVKPKLK